MSKDEKIYNCDCIECVTGNKCKCQCKQLHIISKSEKHSDSKRDFEQQLISILVDMKKKFTGDIYSELNDKIKQIDFLPKLKKQYRHNKISTINGGPVRIFGDAVFKLLSTLMSTELTIKSPHNNAYLYIIVIQSINISGIESHKKTVDNLKLTRRDLYERSESMLTNDQINIILLLSQINPLVTFFIKILSINTYGIDIDKKNIFLTTPGTGIYKNEYYREFPNYLDLYKYKNIPYYILFKLTLKEIICLQILYLNMFGNTTFDTIDILTFNTKLETIYGDDYHNIKLIDLLRKYFNVYYIGEYDNILRSFNITFLKSKNVMEAVKNASRSEKETNSLNIFMGAGNANKPGGGLKLPEMVMGKTFEHDYNSLPQKKV